MKISYKLRAIAFFLMSLMVFYVLPVNCLSDIVSALSGEETEITENETMSSLDKEVYVLGEDISKREESVKHFRMSDGSFVAVQYAENVHYLDSDGTYAEYDNTLSLSTSVSSGSLTNIQSGNISAGNITSINGYKANKSDVSITLANNASQNALTSISKGEYSVSIIPLSLNASSKVVVNNTASKPTLSSKPTIEEASKLYKHTSSVKYKDLFSGADLEYVLSGNKLKENIVVNTRADSYVYSFNLNLTGLYAVLNEDGSISLIGNNTDKVEFTIPAGYMFDNAGAYSDGVTYSLTAKPNGNYTLTVTADSEWINNDDRVFPVTVDPTIVNTTSNLTMKGYYYKEGSFLSTNTPTLIGTRSGYEWIVLAKIKTLPTLPLSAHVYETSFKVSAITVDGDFSIGAYRILNDWSSIVDASSLNEAIHSDFVSYINIEDGNHGLNSWNITSVARDWLNGNGNYGICLQGIDCDDSYLNFSNSSNYSDDTTPILTIKYTDMNGLEDYWAYSTYPVFDIGSANINLATGKLSLSLGTLSTTDFLMPYMPTLTYNSTYAGEYNVGGITNVTYRKALAGYGFKWSMNETIVEKEFPSANGETKTYYIFSDSDGTEHAFTEDENTEKIVDEDGLGLELSYSSSNYTITYPDKTVKTFVKQSAGTNFVAGGILNSIKDKNGNEIKFGLNTYGGVGTIGVYPKGSSTVASQLTLTHNNNCKVKLVVNSTTKEAYIFYYSSSQTGGTLSTDGNGYLRKIIRAHYTGTSSSPDWSGFMSGETTSGFVTDETYLFTYNNRYLKTISDVNADKQYDFTTTNKKTNIVCEKADLSSLTIGQKHMFTYGDGFTKVRTPGKDDVQGNNDDIMTTYTFDNRGRNKNTYSYTADKSEMYGGTGYMYENEAEEYSGVDRIKNNLRSTAYASSNDTNYLLDGGFEIPTTISAAGGISWKYSNSGRKNVSSSGTSFASVPHQSTSGYIEQNVYLSHGTYTLSFDVWKSSATSSAEFEVKAKIKKGTQTLKEETVFISSEKSIQSLTFNISSSTPVKTTVVISVSRAGGSNNDYVGIDNVMLTANSTSANYSLIQNGNFEKIHYNSSSVLTDVSQSLWGGNAIYGEFSNYSSNSLFGRSLMLYGGVPIFAEASQTIYNYSGTSPNGFGLEVSGYALGTKQAIGTNSVFAIRVDVEYYEGGVEKYYINFEPNIKNEWQFVSQTLNFNPETDIISSIKIACEYSYHPGNAYFDNISVSIIPSESYDYNMYYTDEDSPEHGLLMTSVNGSCKTFYAYDNNKNVVKKAIIKGNKGEIYNYTYLGNNLTEEKHYSFTGTYNYTGNPASGDTEFLPEKNITKTFISHAEYVYNNYGQITQTKYREITHENGQVSQPPIVTTNEYKTTSGSKIFGALMSTTDTLGNITRYFYDETKGLLLAEVYSDNKGLAYEYDSRNRLILTLPVTYNKSTNTRTKITDQEKVNYLYNSNGYISKIATESTEYYFTYDCFGNSDTVKVGNKTLADYEYNSNNGKVKSLTYGNGTKIEYVYDSLDRVIQICYTEVGGTKQTLYEYSYTNEGYLKQFDNNVDNTSTIYTYNGAGKLIGTIQCDQNEVDAYYSVTYLYDEFGRSSRTITNITDERSATQNKLLSHSTYDLQGRITSVSYSEAYSGLSGNISSVYDNIHRLKTRTVSFSGFSQSLSYTYEGDNQGTTYTYDDTTSFRVKTYQSTVGNTTKTYTYNYDDAGYITDVISGNQQIADYEYDDQGQITIFNDRGIIYGYTYDNAGNIISRYEDYLVIGEGTKIFTYTYGNSQWGDLLTAFNGASITYDTIGNPLKYYDGKTFKWEQGRRLSTVTNNGIIIGSYDYDENGRRTRKTTQWSSFKYVLDGSQIVAETWDDCINIYLYDEYGSPIGFLHRYENMAEDTYKTYFFEKNMFGDIIAIYDQNGVKQVSYSYDAFGNSTQTTHVSGTRATYNNLRYRGYYYDSETGFYYLNSRYYDPVTCRFINADSPFITTATPMSLTDKNLFSYCDNNPVIREDNGGYFWETVFDIVSLGASIVEVCITPTNPWSWAGLVGDAVDLIPFVTGVGEITRAVKTTKKIAEGVDDVADIAKASFKAVDTVKGIEKATGSYEIIYKSGKNYVGKGGFKRALNSAIEHAKPNRLNNYLGDEVVAVRWKSSPNSRQAFVDEFIMQLKKGVNNDSTYNKIWSPGRKHFYNNLGRKY